MSLKHNYFQESDKTTISQNTVVSCPTGYSIAIIKSDFGRDMYSMACDGKLKKHILYQPENDFEIFYVRKLDTYNFGEECTTRLSTTDEVRELCQNKQTCVIKANSTYFPDPCPDVVKQLRVWYQCVSFPSKTLPNCYNFS